MKIKLSFQETKDCQNFGNETDYKNVKAHDAICNDNL